MDGRVRLEATRQMTSSRSDGKIAKKNFELGGKHRIRVEVKE